MSQNTAVEAAAKTGMLVGIAVAPLAAVFGYVVLGLGFAVFGALLAVGGRRYRTTWDTVKAVGARVAPAAPLTPCGSFYAQHEWEVPLWAGIMALSFVIAWKGDWAVETAREIAHKRFGGKE